MDADDNIKLAISIIFDLLGKVTYAIPFIGDLLDIPFALVQTTWIKYAYKSTPAALLGGLEELLPFTDIIPACTITHFVMLYRRKKGRAIE